MNKENYLINQLASLTAPPGFRKDAGLFETLGLDSIGDSIRSFFHEHFHNSDEVPGGYATSFVSLLAPAVLFRINPIFGILATIADQFGLNFEFLVKKIGDALKPKIEAGEPITPEEVNQIGESLGGVSSTAFVNGLQWMIKEAKGYRGYSSSGPEIDIPFLMSDKSGGILSRIFGNLGNLKGKRMIIGFIVWIVKTALGGAGLLAGGDMVGKMLGHKRIDRIRQESEPKVSPTEEEYHPSPEANVPEVKPEHKPESSIKKDVDQAFNKAKKLWLVPILGSIAETLKIWIMDLNPELELDPEIDSKIESSPGFHRMVNRMKMGSRVGDKLIMPPELTSRQQVVNSFLGEIK